jgi:hypothetical protein
MTIHNKFNNTELVYLRTDPDQLQRMVTGIKICLTSELMYELSSGTIVSWHYEMELSRDKQII